MRALWWVTAAQLALQLAMGVVGFAGFAADLFPEVTPVAALAFRLAAWTNVTMVGLVAWLLRRGDDADVRAAALAALAYHALAAIEGLSRADGASALAEVAAGAARFHGACAVSLVSAWLWARPR